ncbi:MAG: hypothetical protein AMXMBFR80_02790 [Dehalococcoidia bacterium]
MPLEQPEEGGGEDDGGADDAIELELLEQEHALDEVVVGGARTAEREPEDGTEDQVKENHGSAPVRR